MSRSSTRRIVPLCRTNADNGPIAAPKSRSSSAPFDSVRQQLAPTNVALLTSNLDKLVDWSKKVISAGDVGHIQKELGRSYDSISQSLFEFSSPDPDRRQMEANLIIMQCDPNHLTDPNKMSAVEKHLADFKDGDDPAKLFTAKRTMNIRVSEVPTVKNLLQQAGELERIAEQCLSEVKEAEVNKKHLTESLK